MIKIVESGDSNADSLEDATNNLRDELLDVSGVTVTRPVSQESPAGTRSTLPEMAGYLAVSLLVARGGYTARDAARGIAEVIHHWIDRHKDTEAEIRRPDGSVLKTRNMPREDLEQIFLVEVPGDPEGEVR